MTIGRCSAAAREIPIGFVRWGGRNYGLLRCIVESSFFKVFMYYWRNWATCSDFEYGLDVSRRQDQIAFRGAVQPE